MIKIFGWECTLETCHSHSECHGIHIDKIGVFLCFTQLLFTRVFIYVNWGIYFNCTSSSCNYIFC
jgi:hypothetical protein